MTTSYYKDILNLEILNLEGRKNKIRGLQEAKILLNSLRRIQMGPEMERVEARKKGKKRYQSAGIPSKVEAPVEVDERPKPW